ncbi:MAG: hypothetical protein AAB548_00210 [Patescibacteria group bacterium]
MNTSTTPTHRAPKARGFYLAGFSSLLPLESKFEFQLILAELANIPLKYNAELKIIEADLALLVYDVAHFGVIEATSADCRSLLAKIRHQAKVCAAIAHRADIKADEQFRLKQQAKSRRHQKPVEYKGDGTLADLAGVNAEKVSTEPVSEQPRFKGKASRRANRQAKKAALAAPRPWEK